MSVVRVSPELLATVETGAIVQVVDGGAPPGAAVSAVRIPQDDPTVVEIYVDDGAEGVSREVVLEKFERVAYVVGMMHPGRECFVGLRDFATREEAESYLEGANADSDGEGVYFIAEVVRSTR